MRAFSIFSFTFLSLSVFTICPVDAQIESRRINTEKEYFRFASQSLVPERSASDLPIPSDPPIPTVQPQTGNVQSAGRLPGLGPCCESPGCSCGCQVRHNIRHKCQPGPIFGHQHGGSWNPLGVFHSMFGHAHCYSSGHPTCDCGHSYLPEMSEVNSEVNSTDKDTGNPFLDDPDQPDNGTSLPSPTTYRLRNRDPRSTPAPKNRVALKPTVDSSILKRSNNRRVTPASVIIIRR